MGWCRSSHTFGNWRRMTRRCAGESRWPLSFSLLGRYEENNPPLTASTRPVREPGLVWNGLRQNFFPPQDWGSSDAGLMHRRLDVCQVPMAASRPAVWEQARPLLCSLMLAPALCGPPAGCGPGGAPDVQEGPGLPDEAGGAPLADGSAVRSLCTHPLGSQQGQRHALTQWAVTVTATAHAFVPWHAIQP